jgi:hypothetical protein
MTGSQKKDKLWRLQRHSVTLAYQVATGAAVISFLISMVYSAQVSFNKFLTWTGMVRHNSMFHNMIAGTYPQTNLATTRWLGGLQNMVVV